MITSAILYVWHGGQLLESLACNRERMGYIEPSLCRSLRIDYRDLSKFFTHSRIIIVL